MANAIYIWSKSPLNQYEFIKNCSIYNISHVFLSAYRFVDNRDYFSNIIINNNLKFFAMASTNEFLKRHNLALKYIDDVISFNKKVGDKQSFSGIHFDIEPYVLPEYKQFKKEILSDYISLLKKCYEKISSHGLEFGVSIPYWYKYKQRRIFVDVNGKNKCCLNSIVDNSDHISIMAYRANVNQIVGSVKAEMNYSKKQVFVAVNNLLNLKRISDTLFKHYSFEGLAIHHYHKLISLD